jgi:hypothetical protein
MSRCRRPKGDFGAKPAAQSAEGPDLLRFTGSLNRRGGETRRGAHDSKQMVAHDRPTASRKPAFGETLIRAGVNTTPESDQTLDDERVRCPLASALHRA